jgi:hypothetical protein
VPHHRTGAADEQQRQYGGPDGQPAPSSRHQRPA